MGYSINTFTYTGNSTFPLNFSAGILERDDVTVRVNDENQDGLPVYRDFTWIDDDNIRVTSDLVDGDQVIIERSVRRDKLEVNFTTSDDLTKINVDKQTLHILMLVHEALDGRIDRLDTLGEDVESIICTIQEINANRNVENWKLLPSLCDLTQLTTAGLVPESDDFRELPSLCDLG